MAALREDRGVASSVRVQQQEVLQQVRVPLVVLQPLGVLAVRSMMAKDLLMVVACRQTAQRFHSQ